MYSQNKTLYNMNVKHIKKFRFLQRFSNRSFHMFHM